MSNSWQRERVTNPVTHNVYVVTVLRLLIIYLLYFLMRVVFYVANRDLLAVDSWSSLSRMFGASLIFDTSGILYTNLLFILLSLLPLRHRTHPIYQKVVAFFYFVPNTIAIILNMGDVVYYRFTKLRTTSTVIHEFAHDSLWKFMGFFVDYWWVTLLGLLFFVLMVFLYRLTSVERERLHGIVFYPLYTLLFLLSIGLCVGGLRGGFTHATRPITLSNATKYIDKPDQRALVLNTPFAFIRTYGDKALEDLTFMPEAQAYQIYNATRTYPDSSTYSGLFKGRNVVLVIWESFAREWVGALNHDIKGYKGFTPFVDSLCQRSYVFDHAYANGLKSIDAMPSVLTSLPHVGVPFVLSFYSNDRLNSLASLLKTMGYHSAFFHGAENGSMGFQAFASQIGYDQYIGRTEYNNDKDFDGHWGIWDEPFLQFMAKRLSSLSQPFFSTVFTLSSHHPFIVPKQFEGHFPKGHIPMHQVIGYSDYALKRFFETASQQPWYHNTIFVIVADHAVPGWLKEYKTPVMEYAIPIIIFDPQGDLKGVDHHTAQQLDIMPTLLGLLGYHGHCIAFGHDLFDPTQEKMAFNNNGDTYRLVKGDSVLIFTNHQLKGLYDMSRDHYLNNNLLDSLRYRPLRDSLDLKAKAILQEYTHRVIHNKLVIQNQ